MVERVVRTTGAVASEAPPADDAAGFTWLPLVTAATTPPATAPPTSALAITATARTRLAENSAIRAFDRNAASTRVLLEAAGASPVRFHASSPSRRAEPRSQRWQSPSSVVCGLSDRDGDGASCTKREVTAGSQL